jgi:hypothetical protein
VPYSTTLRMSRRLCVANCCFLQQSAIRHTQAPTEFFFPSRREIRGLPLRAAETRRDVKQASDANQRKAFLEGLDTDAIRAVEGAEAIIERIHVTGFWFSDPPPGWTF